MATNTKRWILRGREPRLRVNVHQHLAGSDLACRRGLATCLGSLDDDCANCRQAVGELAVDDPRLIRKGANDRSLAGRLSD